MTRTKGKTALVALAVAAAAVGAYGWQRQRAEERAEQQAEQQRLTRAGRALANLHRCLTGVAADTEAGGHPLRLVELADNPGWPGRCAVHASELYAALTAAEAELKRALEEHFDCAQACVIDEPAEQLAALPSLAILPVVPPTVDPPSRAQAPRFDMSSLSAWTGPDAKVVDRQERADGSVALLVRGTRDKGQLCTVAPKSNQVTCTESAATALPELALPEPEQLAERTPDAVISQRCSRGAGVVVMIDERALLFFDSKDWSAPVSFVDETKADGAKPAASKNEKQPQRADRKALDDAANFGAAGLLSGADAPSGDSPWGKIPGGSLAQQKRMFDEPTKVTPKRVRQAIPHLPRHMLRCTDEGATVVWRQPEARADVIHVARCTADGCKHEQAAVEALDVKSWWYAADVGGSLSLAWRDRRGIVRHRFAALAQLDGADSRPLLDLPAYGGSDAQDLEVFSSGSGLVVLFRDRGMRGFVVDAKGEAAALALTEAQP